MINLFNDGGKSNLCAFFNELWETSRVDQQDWHLKNTWKELSLAVLYKYTRVFNKLHVLWVSLSVFPLLVEWNNVLCSEQHARESKGTAQRKQEETQWAKHLSRPWSNISQSLTDTFPCAISWCKKALCVSISHNSTSNTPNYPLNTEADSTLQSYSCKYSPQPRHRKRLRISRDLILPMTAR